MGVTHSLEICTLSQRTLYRNLTFSSTKVFHRICSRLEVTAHQQNQMWPRWRRHISISTAPFKDTSASCSYLTPSILSTAVTLTTHSAQRFSTAREGTGRCWGTKRPERALLRVKSGVTYGDSYGRVATQRKPAHLDGSLVLSKGGWPGFRVRKQGHQRQMAGGTNQLYHMEVLGIEACESIAL